MFGEEFCDANILIQTPDSNPQSSQILGWNPKGAKIGFITLTPSLDAQNSFLSQKSSEMLKNIILKVFSLTQRECGIFSLFKTSEIPQNYQDYFKHKEILLAQISQCDAKVFIIFGLEEIAKILFPNQKIQLGSALKFKNKTLVATHSLKALLRLENLKKQTMQHLISAKGLM